MLATAKRSTTPALTQLNDEETMFQASVRKFARERIAPHVREMDEASLFRKELIREFFDLGLMAIDVPEEYGGQGGYFFQSILAIEELAKVDPAAAVIVEDQVSPKKCGHYEGKQVVSKAEMIGKIKAAADTRRDADMVIIARSDARAIERLQAAIDRVNAYLEAGADVGFVEAPQSAAELAAAARQLGKPALVNIFEGGKTPVLPARELEAMGYRIGIYPSQTHRAAIAAAKKVLAVLKRDGDTAAIESELATFNDREEAVNARTGASSRRNT
jgi:2-methylisocitrate lyase-like PEP mutase family enzyme